MRTEPPTGARLGLYRHGDTVSEAAALELCALPAFPDSWLILPTPERDGLTLAWGDACTTAELERASGWNAAQLARFQADRLPSPDRNLQKHAPAYPAPVFLSPGLLL